jgi:hypothetical protein
MNNGPARPGAEAVSLTLAERNWISILRPRTEAALLGRVEPAVLPTGLCRFHWILDQGDGVTGCDTISC